MLRGIISVIHVHYRKRRFLYLRKICTILPRVCAKKLVKMCCVYVVYLSVSQIFFVLSFIDDLNTPVACSAFSNEGEEKYKFTYCTYWCTRIDGKGMPAWMLSPTKYFITTSPFLFYTLMLSTILAFPPPQEILMDFGPYVHTRCRIVF